MARWDSPPSLRWVCFRRWLGRPRYIRLDVARVAPVLTVSESLKFRKSGTQRPAPSPAALSAGHQFQAELKSDRTSDYPFPRCSQKILAASDQTGSPFRHPISFRQNL